MCVWGVSGHLFPHDMLVVVFGHFHGNSLASKEKLDHTTLHDSRRSHRVVVIYRWHSHGKLKPIHSCVNLTWQQSGPQPARATYRQPPLLRDSSDPSFVTL